MRYLILVLAMLIFYQSTYTQDTKAFKKPQTREEFLKRSKGQRIAAWILLGAGTVGILAVSNGDSDFGTTGTVAVLSGAAILTSIPLFIAARRNKKRGLRMPVSLIIEKNSATHLLSGKSTYYPAVSLKFR